MRATYEPRPDAGPRVVRGRLEWDETGAGATVTVWLADDPIPYTATVDATQARAVLRRWTAEAAAGRAAVRVED